jgi:Lrp/AsnC family transcriptional regulator for asnA, asnC and gidA
MPPKVNPRRTRLDPLDQEITRLLVEDGRIPIGALAARLKVTAPTLRKRMRKLEKEGLLKVSGLIDPEKHPEMTTALVGMNIQSRGRMDRILEKIAALPNVVWAGVVTGRYDIIAEVLISGGKNELYRFTTDTILKQGEVVRSESFVIMKSIGNWIRPKLD